MVKLSHKKELTKRVGRSVTLDAGRTTDPDGDRLTFRWWQYAEADSYAGEVAITNADKAEATFVVPADAKTGDTLQFICEVTDNGTPTLTHYARVFVTVK